LLKCIYNANITFLPIDSISEHAAKSKKEMIEAQNMQVTALFVILGDQLLIITSLTDKNNFYCFLF